MTRARAARCRHSLLLVLIATAVAASTQADELYRCTGPNGDTVFSNDPYACPGAEKHQPRGAIQTLPAGTPAAKAPPSGRRNAASTPDHEAGLKAHWQAKKRNAEDELRVLESRSAYLNRFVAGCNRGSAIISEDSAGMKRTVPCSEVRREQAQLASKLEPLREYLRDGLRRECRRAGCLPGWIR